MCWCNPNNRTPVCGKPECHPPEESPTIKALRTELRSLESDVRMRIQLLETKYAVRVEDLILERTEQGVLYKVQANIRL